MIRLAAEYLFLCLTTSIHPTLFISDTGGCIAMCDAHSETPHACYENGHSLTDCYSDEGQSQLCDAYLFWISESDYDSD